MVTKAIQARPDMSKQLLQWYLFLNFILNYKNCIMDLSKILTNAEKAGYTVITLHEKDFNLGNNYIIYFAKNGVVEGYFMTIPNEGFQWSYPQGLIDYVNNLEKPRHRVEEDIFGLD